MKAFYNAANMVPIGYFLDNYICAYNIKLPSDTNITFYNNQLYLTDSVGGIIGIVNYVKLV